MQPGNAIAPLVPRQGVLQHRGELRRRIEYHGDRTDDASLGSAHRSREDPGRPTVVKRTGLESRHAVILRAGERERPRRPWRIDGGAQQMLVFTARCRDDAPFGVQKDYAMVRRVQTVDPAQNASRCFVVTIPRQR